MKRNRLRGMRCYLVGAMDRVWDGGVAWRQKITPFLKAAGVIVLDPCDKPIDVATEDLENRMLREKLKAEGLYDEFYKLGKSIRTIDLRMVDISDFIVASVDTSVHMTGSYEEIFLANRQKKPLILWVQQGKEHTPDWLLFALPHQLIFSTMDEVLSYLNEVDKAKEVSTYNRWVFFQTDKLFPAS